MSNYKKEDRHVEILCHIVNSYIENALPVSSKYVMEKMGKNISSATIRNVMSLMEEEGYIEQPHTSAGRIPTDLGYRRYVDYIKENVTIEKKQGERLENEFSARIEDIKDLIKKTSNIMSRELKGIGIVMWPSLADFYLKRIELIQLRREAVLAILVTMADIVREYIIKIEETSFTGDLKSAENFINFNYESKSIAFLFEDLKKLKNENLRGQINIVINGAYEIIESIIRDNSETEMYWEGDGYFAERFDRDNIDTTRRAFQIFFHKDEIAELMRSELPSKRVNVYIGSENKCDILKECGVVTGGYELDGRVVGRIGVIGPKRMDYDNAFKTVNFFSELLSDKIREMFY
ncbi:Negative regulator of class I heat shock protein [Candidatus Omnitrophus magneticus]|uniref:Heat-inducible transcription repressor HrcA n=1 Tax=Candidatus Omnitrophus magneticus TaxID=1609969 RepID=A0A0F0CU72_9BACT|nr:Negative regulator of class I heat shock protein [Candidatus Omnitrophus magneticus]